MSTEQKAPAKPSLYQRLIAAGVPTSNWQSDLYFPVGIKTREIIEQCLDDGVLSSRPTTFINRVEGGYWYDAAFMFDPFWEKREAKHA